MGAAFDPDAYLKKKAAFDPDAYVKRKASDPGVLPAPEETPESTSFGRTLASQFLQGATKGWADEAAGKIFKATQPVRIQTGPEYSGEEPVDPGNVLRDRLRRESHAAQDAHPVLSFAAHVGGDIASDYLASKIGTPVASTAYQVGSGALAGAGMSEGETIKDVAIDSGIGAGTALFGNAVGRYALGPLAARVAPALRRWLNEKAVDQGRRVLTNGADSLSNRQPVAEEAVKEAIDSGAIKPLGTTQGAFKRLDRLAEDQGAAYGAVVEELEKQGVKGPAAKEIADELMSRASVLRPNTMNDALPAEFEKQAAEVLSKRTFAPKATGTTLTGGTRYAIQRDPNLGLSQTESLKRSLQKLAQYDRTASKPLNDVRKEIASVVREANEEAIEAAGKANPGTDIEHLAEGFVPLKQRLGRILEAREAAQRGAARGAQRRGVGISDYLTANAAAAAGDPTGGLATGAANNFLRNRGTSAVAVGARRIAESAPVRNAREVLPAAVGEVMPPLLRGLGLSSGDEAESRRNAFERVKAALESDPEALGRYARPLVKAAESGEGELAALHYALSAEDEEYRKLIGGAP